MKKVLPFLCIFISETMWGQDFVLVDSVRASGVGFFGGAASSDLTHIVYGPYAGHSGGTSEPLTDDDSLFFIDFPPNGIEVSVRKKYYIGNNAWVAATTGSGSYTVVGTDNSEVLVFQDTTLVAAGEISGNPGQKRGIAISEDENYFGVGGGTFTLHELTSTTPLTPVYSGITGWFRAVDFSFNNQYCVFGGRLDSLHLTYLGIYDLAVMSLVFSDTIPQPIGEDGELRQVTISSDGNRILGGTFGIDNPKLYYYVRTDTTSNDWVLQDELDSLSRIYWVDMDSTGRFAVVATQGTNPDNIGLYELSDSSMTLRWKIPGSKTISPSLDGGVRFISITPTASHIVATTRGGGNGGGQVFVLDTLGNVIFSYTSYAPESGGIYENSDSWFCAISEDATRLTFASFGGFAYFFASDTTTTSILDDKSSPPTIFSLKQNYPNPFNPVTTLRYDIPEQAFVTLVVYDLLGREVKMLVNRIEEPGYKSVVWDGADNAGQPVGAGVYLYRISSDKFTKVNKMILLR